MKDLFIITFLAAITCYSCGEQNELSDAYGNFEATEIIVSAENQGKILEFVLREGDEYQAGSVIGMIDTIQLHLQREQILARQSSVLVKKENIWAQIEIHKEQRKILLQEKERLEHLLRDGAVTSKQMDDLVGQLSTLEKQIFAVETNFPAINSEIAVLSTQLDLINDQLSRCILKNPVKGTVLEKYVEPFEMAVPGKSLYKIADLSEMMLRVYVSGDQLPALSTGQKVSVFIDKDKKQNQELEGTVSWISAKSEFTPKIIQTKKERVNLVYAVKVRVINDGRLKIGMPGEIMFD